MIGLLMIVVPIAIFLATLSLSKRLKPALHKTYLVLGGIVVFLGSAVSIYFATYSGDQGGIAAFYFQVFVIFVYAALSLSLVIINWILCAWETRSAED